MNRRLISAGVVVAIAAALGAGYLVSNQNRATQVSVATATRGPLTETVTASGKVVPDRSISIFAPVAGTLSSVSVRDGQRVKKGDRLARLATAPLDLAVAQAESLLAAARAMPTATSRLRTARTQAIQAAQSGLNLARGNRGKANLVAPVAGTVTVPATTAAGAGVTPGAALFTLVATGSLVFAAEVDESDIARIAPKQAASVSLDALTKPLSGTVASLASTAITTDTGGNAFLVRIPVKDPAGLRQGMSGSATIEVASVPDALLVPVQALQVDAGKRYLFVLDADNRIHRTEVTIGASTDTVAEIRSGVDEGARVVTGPLLGLTDGMTVRVS